MPYQPFHEVLPGVARKETRVLVVTPDAPPDALPPGIYTLNEMYCDEIGCDCRRVLFFVEVSFRPGPEAVIAWGWELREFYARWLGEDDEAVLDQLEGPALNLGSRQTELSVRLLDAVRQLLREDSAYRALLRDHYRQFRERIAPPPAADPRARAPRTAAKCEGRVVPAPLAAESDVANRLREAGIDTAGPESRCAVALHLDDDGRVIPHGDTLPVTDGVNATTVSLESTSALFRGNRQPPTFGDKPPAEYVPFFLAIERAAYEYCEGSGEVVRDKDFEKLYNDLRRRPDGSGQHPATAHVQAAIRLYMTLRDVSQAEYEAVLRRLTFSARAFAMGYSSTNYFERALVPLFQASA